MKYNGFFKKIKKRKNKIRYKCPCCDYYTLGAKGYCEICPVCYWEDDPTQREDPNLDDSANKISLNQARKNYIAYGVYDMKFKKHVRPPKEEEKAE